jgi:hypothetical protein
MGKQSDPAWNIELRGAGRKLRIILLLLVAARAASLRSRLHSRRDGCAGVERVAVGVTCGHAVDWDACAKAKHAQNGGQEKVGGEKAGGAKKRGRAG